MCYILAANRLFRLVIIFKISVRPIRLRHALLFDLLPSYLDRCRDRNGLVLLVLDMWLGAEAKCAFATICLTAEAIGLMAMKVTLGAIKENE